MSSSLSVPALLTDNAPAGAVALDDPAGTLARSRRLTRRAEHLGATPSRLQAAITAALGRAEVGTITDGPVVSDKASMRIFVSQTFVKARYRLIARECSDITQVRPLRLVDA